MKYAWHGSIAFEEFLELNLQELVKNTSAVLGDNLSALVLAGGYGRGEGGIVKINGVEKPYNDLDLVPVLKKNSPKAALDLLPLSRKFAEKLAIHVDFSRPLTEALIRQLPHKLMWQDLLNGHIILFGDKDILTRNMPEYMRHSLPVIEASHLLLNRGAGLIWSLAILEGYLENNDPDFVRRNYFKAALAMGDAVLIANSRHQTSYRGRDNLLESLGNAIDFPGRDELMPLYRRALHFKFSPDSESGFEADKSKLKQLASMFVDVFISIESQRMGRNFAGAAEYSAANSIREAAEHSLKKLPRNLYHNLRHGCVSLRYPREILYRNMPSLLTASTRESGWAEKCLTFLALWEKFN